MAKFRDITQHLIHQLIQLPTITVPVALMVKQNAKNAVAHEENFRDHIVKQDQNKDQNSLPLPPTGLSKDPYKTTEDDKNGRS